MGRANSVLATLGVGHQRRRVIATAVSIPHRIAIVVLVVLLFLILVRHQTLEFGLKCILECRATLPRLRLEEDLGHHQLSVLLFFVEAQVVLMHYPVCLLGLPLLAVVGVENEDLLVPLQITTCEHRPRLPGLMPPRLASMHVGVHLSPLPRPRRVCSGRAMEEVSNQPIASHACISSQEEKCHDTTMDKA